jgi:hypothetical protein
MTAPFTRAVLLGLLLSIPVWFAIAAAAVWWLTP